MQDGFPLLGKRNQQCNMRFLSEIEARWIRRKLPIGQWPKQLYL